MYEFALFCPATRPVPRRRAAGKLASKLPWSRHKTAGQLWDRWFIPSIGICLVDRSLGFLGPSIEPRKPIVLLE